MSNDNGIKIDVFLSDEQLKVIFSETLGKKCTAQNLEQIKELLADIDIYTVKEKLEETLSEIVGELIEDEMEA